MKDPARFQRRLRRVVEHINYHKECPQVDAIRGGKLGWDYIVVCAQLLEWALEDGRIGEQSRHIMDKPFPGASALRKKDVA